MADWLRDKGFVQRARVAVSAEDAYGAMRQTFLSADLPWCQWGQDFIPKAI